MASTSGQKEVIKRITGYEVSTCPWRANYDPLVIDVLSVAWAIEKGNLSGVIGDDPPAVLVDAIGTFYNAFLATINEDRRIRDEERKRRNLTRG